MKYDFKHFPAFLCHISWTLEMMRASDVEKTPLSNEVITLKRTCDVTDVLFGCEVRKVLFESRSLTPRPSDVDLWWGTYFSVSFIYILHAYLFLCESIYAKVFLQSGSNALISLCLRERGVLRDWGGRMKENQCMSCSELFSAFLCFYAVCWMIKEEIWRRSWADFHILQH